VEKSSATLRVRDRGWERLSISGMALVKKSSATLGVRDKVVRIKLHTFIAVGGEEQRDARSSRQVLASR
jgi:hypothetical protein